MSEEIVSSEDIQFYEYLGLLEQAYYDTHVGSKAGTIITETIKSYVNILKYKNNKLQQKVEQLENIRKEAIEYVYKHIQEYDADGTFTNLEEFDFIASPQVLLNILNKGSDK